MKFGPTKRSALFRESILTPVSITYCSTEFLKDTPHFLKKISDFETELCSINVKLFSVDVKALYPSIDPTYLPVAIETALRSCNQFQSRKNTIHSKFGQIQHFKCCNSL